MVIKFFFHEPAECNNKTFKRFRDMYARKTSREANLTDTFVRTSVVSDPILLKHVFKFKKNLRKGKREAFPPAVLNLLKPTAIDNIK